MGRVARVWSPEEVKGLRACRTYDDVVALARAIDRSLGSVNQKWYLERLGPFPAKVKYMNTIRTPISESASLSDFEKRQQAVYLDRLIKEIKRTGQNRVFKIGKLVRQDWVI